MRRRRHRSSIGRAMPFAIAKPRLRSEKIIKTKPSVASVVRSFLQELEDRREFHPEADKRPARAKRRADAALVVPQKSTSFVPSAVGFSRPGGVALCVRRHARREVLHAKGIAGSHVRPGRWSEYSWIDCRPDGRGGHRSKKGR